VVRNTIRPQIRSAHLFLVLLLLGGLAGGLLHASQHHDANHASEQCVVCAWTHDLTVTYRPQLIQPMAVRTGWITVTTPTVPFHVRQAYSFTLRSPPAI